MWTEITRRKYERGGQRYASDLTDGEWALIEPHMPAAKPLGRPREIELRAVLDAILYIARTGCQWRMLPKDFPPFTTVQGYFYDWRDNSLFETINFTLLLQAREAAGREASPTASRSSFRKKPAPREHRPALRLAQYKSDIFWCRPSRSRSCELAGFDRSFRLYHQRPRRRVVG